MRGSFFHFHNLSMEELTVFLNQKAEEFESPDFIKDDPVSIPHLFTQKEDIEISGFLTASIAWGKRQNIISSANKLMELMEYKPYEFVLHAGKPEIKRLDKFIYRTFNNDDLVFFISSLRMIYMEYGGIEEVFSGAYQKNKCVTEALIHFREIFLKKNHLKRSEKHISSAAKGSACKRLNLFLRWMVRPGNKGVDFGLWKKINTSELLIPLDLHTGVVSRSLGLLQRKQNDLRAVCELTEKLRTLDAADPVKYDFALFCIGVHKKLS